MTSTSDSVEICSGTLIYFYGGDAVVDQTPSEVKRLWDDASGDEMIELSIDGVEAFVLREDLGAMFPTFRAVELPLPGGADEPMFALPKMDCDLKGPDV